MAQRATSLGPKPSLFYLFFVFLCFFFLFFLCFPFFAFFSLLYLKNPVFPPPKKKGCFLLLIVLCFPLFLFSIFLASPFSLSLSLSLSSSFLSSLLPVSHVNFWFLLFGIGLFAFCFKMFFLSDYCLVLFESQS